VAARVGDGDASDTVAATFLAGAGVEGHVAVGGRHALDARRTPLSGGPEPGGGRPVLAAGALPPAFIRTCPADLDEIANARPGMERQDIPAWVDDVLRRKEAQAEELAAHVSDAPDEAWARRRRWRGWDAELTRTLDEQRALREASGAPPVQGGAEAHPDTSGEPRRT
jgi:hypothetical protein